MRSVADLLRRELALRVRAMRADARVALTERLARDDLDLFRRAHALDPAAALQLLRLRRRAGRRRSRVMESLGDE